MTSCTGSSSSSVRPMPRARPARSAAPAEAASPERCRMAGTPSMAVRTSTHTGRREPEPPSVTPSALEPPRRPTVTTSMTRRTSQATDSITARARSAGPWAAPRPMNPARGVVAPPGRPRAVEPRDGDHAPRAGWALAGETGQLVRGAVDQAPEPGQERPGGGQPPLEEPTALGGPRDNGTGRRRHGALLYRHRHVARGAPAHHGVVLGRARPEDLALAVTGADDDGDTGPQPELGARDRFQLAHHRVGGDDARQLAERGPRQLTHRVAVEVVEPAPRSEGGVRDDLVRHAEDDVVTRRKDEVGRLQAFRLVFGEPGQLGGDRARVERDPRAGPVDVVTTHARRPAHAPRVPPGGRTKGCPCRSGPPARSWGRRSGGHPSRRRRRPSRTPAAPAPGPRRRR